MRSKESTKSATPSIQVIERMFTLIDVLASREEAVSLKEISEKTGLHPSTATSHPQRSDAGSLH